MMLGSCKSRDDVDSMLRKGYWPNGCDEELHAHVEGCQQCQEWILLTQSFQRARRESIEEARLGSSFLLWWKAELRRRDTALTQASRPMMLAHSFAVVVGVVAVVVLLMLARGSILDWFTQGGLWQTSKELQADMSAFWGSFGVGNLVLLVSGLAAVALVGGVVYLASDR